MHLTREDYTSSAAEMLVWYMFEELDVPTIYRMLSNLAEQDGVTADEIKAAWATFDEMRSHRKHPDGLT